MRLQNSTRAGQESKPGGSGWALPLGTNAKSASPVQINSDTGEVLPEAGGYDPAAVRLSRYALQSTARRLLPLSRTAKCLRLMAHQPGASGVQVLKSKQHGSTFYAGLQTCASVWACPVCAAKISERRRVELVQGIEAHKAAGGTVAFVTLTNPHAHGDVLADVLEKQRAALKGLWTGKAAHLWRQSVGYVGSVRALEVTHGRKRERSNGWHPHYHILLFLAPGVSLLELRRDLFSRWLRACRRAGLGDPSESFGVTVQDGEWAADYASKWGLEQEMTKGHSKTAGKDPGQAGETPFDLLRAVLADPDDKEAARLFREFAAAFHGKRQLFWSPGLKRHFGIGEASDVELAAAVEDDAAVLGSIEFEDWRRIVRANVRGEVLELARHGWEAVLRLIESLRLRAQVTPDDDARSRMQKARAWATSGPDPG